MFRNRELDGLPMPSPPWQEKPEPGLLVRTATAALLFVLLREWLKWVAILSGMDEPDLTFPLYAALAGYLFIDALKVPVWFGIPAKFVMSLVTVGWLFGVKVDQGGFMAWLADYVRQAGADLGHVLVGPLQAISSDTRTLLFIMGWGLLASVIYSVLLHSGRCLWLLVMTLAFLLGLQLWPGLDTTGGLMAVCAAGLFLLAVLNLERLRWTWPSGVYQPESDHFFPLKSSRQEAEWRRSRGKWWLSALGLVSLFTLCSLAGAGSPGQTIEPLSERVWMQLADGWQVPWFNQFESRLAVARSYQQDGRRLTGYGRDDASLGGPISPDVRVAFIARTPVPTYWRGESKRIYNGKGWSEPVQPPSVSFKPADQPAGQQAFPTVTIRQELLYNGGPEADLLFAGGPIVQVELLMTDKGAVLDDSAVAVREPSGKYAVRSDSGQLSYARFKVQIPAYDPEQLAQAVGEYPESVRRDYLQLPDSLPDRVKRLATELTNDLTSPYAMAKAIENHLKTNYTYSMEQAAVPGPEQDFADMFLFETKTGYCDYFSTAMVVLLRAAGVPARWVKGFAPGEARTEVREEGGNTVLHTVTVRRSDAHSWVEAYIPGAGWVLFDPTPSTGTGGSDESIPPEPGIGTDVAADGGDGHPAWRLPEDAGEGQFPKTDADDSNLADPVPSGREPLTEPSNRNPSLAEGPETGGTEPKTPLWRTLADKWVRWILRYGWAVAAVSAVVLLLVGWGYRSRRRLRGLAFRLRLELQGRQVRRISLLEELWQEAFRQFGGKRPGQTVREYSAEVAARRPDLADALAELVDLYERHSFGRERRLMVPKQQLLRLWRRLFGTAFRN